MARKKAGAGTVQAKDLAVNGGAKTVAAFEGKAQPKVGLDEFMALADTWGYSAASQAKIRKILEPEAMAVSPQLTRYYNPRPSRVKMLEEYAAARFGVKYALAVNSGTSALTAAYVAAGIGPGDEIIIPAYTFFATAAAVVAAKALPVIANVDDSLTLDPADVARRITPRTKAIVPVHMVGNGCNMDRIKALARQHKLLVVEDNAQACGGLYKGQFLGTIGDLGCFSISSYKITGGGEGGLVLTNDEWLYIRAQNQHDTAACWRPDRYARERQPGELFCGQNYRMSELEGTVNLVQLRKTVAQARRYRTNAQRIVGRLDAFRDTRVRRSNDPDGDVGYALVLMAKNREAAAALAAALAAEGVPCGSRGAKTARDWHVATFWEHIIEQKSATKEGCPFTCPYRKAPLPDYAPEQWAPTVDLLDRAVFISVNQWWTARDGRNVAAAINKVCAVLG